MSLKHIKIELLVFFAIFVIIVYSQGQCGNNMNKEKYLKNLRGIIIERNIVNYQVICS